MLAFVHENVTRNCLIGLIFLFFYSISHAELPVQNHNPLTLLVGVPELISATKLISNEQIFALNSTISSHFIESDLGNDKLVFDGETYVTNFIWRRGFSQVEMELLIPYISYQNGFMDEFIIDWHRSFNLPGGSREDVKNNQLLFYYKGENTALMDTPSEGLGDIRLTLGKQIIKQTEYQLAFQTLLKLPTGDSQYWLGSGSADVSFYVTQAWQKGNWNKQFQLGMIMMDTPDILPDQRRAFAGFASTAVNYALADHWQIIIQLDMQTPMYKNSKKLSLGDSELFSVGSKWQTKMGIWHFALLEDIHVHTAPDVGFQFGWQYGNAPPS